MLEARFGLRLTNFLTRSTSRAAQVLQVVKQTSYFWKCLDPELCAIAQVAEKWPVEIYFPIS